jgi:hypothetical protein
VCVCVYTYLYAGIYICTHTHTHTHTQVLQRAIDEDYYFEFIYDDLPLWGFIGEPLYLFDSIYLL